MRTPIYRATATVLLRPNDPTEQLNPNNAGQVVGADADRYVAGQESIARSTPVAQEAAKTLRGITSRQIQDAVSVTQGGQSNVLNVAAKDPEPSRARDIANAVAKGYIENRRQSAVAGLQGAAKDIQDKLAPLQAQIGQLDARLGSASTTGGTSQLVSPVPPASSTAAAQPTPPTATGIDPGGVASTEEALKAARYAAAVQYETLYARQQELLVDISLKRGEAELVAEANLPTAPASPHPLRDGILGAFVGLLLGVGISFLRDQLNDRVRSGEEVAKIIGLPLLAQLPFDAGTGKDSPTGAAVVDRPTSPFSEAMRSLRTSIQYLGVDRPIKVIVVTSSMPGEGKSLVSANLAAIFAQADYRTLLVSADLRRPSIDAFFGSHDSSPGLTGLIAPEAGMNGPARVTENGTGKVAIADGKARASPVVKTPVRNLLLMPAGAAPPNPAELLASRRMTDLLVEWGSAADVVIIDTPPLLAVTDAAVVAAKSDGVILVAALNEAHRDSVKRAKAILEGTGARILGVVANKAPASGSGAYYGGYYHDPAVETRKGWRALARRLGPDRESARPS